MQQPCGQLLIEHGPGMLQSEGNKGINYVVILDIRAYS
jgi:hypothetical protein